MSLSFRGKWTRWIFALLSAILTATAAGQVSVTSKINSRNENAAIVWASVTLANPMSRPASGELEFTGYGNTARISVDPIPAGHSRHFNVPIPLKNVQSGTFRENGQDAVRLNFESSYYGGDPVRFFYASDEGNRLSENEMDALTYRLSSNIRSTGYVMGTGITKTTATFGTAAATVTSRPLSANERVVTQSLLSDLPENWLCYTPFKSVILSRTDYRHLSAGQRGALDTWVSLGGTLTLFGDNKNAKVDVERGAILSWPDNPITDPEFDPTFENDAIVTANKVSGAAMPFQEKNAGGRGGAFFLATLFLIIVGPVNYIYFSRRGEIRKLIVTVPIISVAFCSMIGVYFVATQGFNRKGGSMSITTVDEESNRAVTFARHSLLSGLYPLGGFHFAPRTYLQFETNPQMGAASFDLTRDIVLTNGLFQPGIPCEYSTILPYTTRERMIYDADDGSLRNGFELPVKAVAVLRNGTYFTGGAAAPGARVMLTAVDPAQVTTKPTQSTPASRQAETLVRMLGQKSLETRELENAANLTREVMNFTPKTSATLYAAIFDGIPKSSQPGVEISDGRNLHIVIGRVASEGAK